MIFAFLSTAMMYFCAVLLMITCIVMMITGWFPYQPLLIALFVTAAVALILSRVLAVRLYMNTVTKVNAANFGQWMKRQKGIARRSVGNYKLTVRLNMAFQAIAYDKTDLASQLLTEIKPIIEKKNHAYYNFVYLSDIIGLKEKLHDSSGFEELFAAMYENLKSPSFPDGNTYQRMCQNFEYQRLEWEFYNRTPEQLAGADRRLTEQFNLSARMRLQNSQSKRTPDLYHVLSAYYNMGLTYYLLGETQQAAACFRQLAESDQDFPFLERARQFWLHSSQEQDLSMLMQSIP